MPSAVALMTGAQKHMSMDGLPEAARRTNRRKEWKARSVSPARSGNPQVESAASRSSSRPPEAQHPEQGSPRSRQSRHGPLRPAGLYREQ